MVIWIFYGFKIWKIMDMAMAVIHALISVVDKSGGLVALANGSSGRSTRGGQGINCLSGLNLAAFLHFLTGIEGFMILRLFSSKYRGFFYPRILSIHKLHVPYLLGFDGPLGAVVHHLEIDNIVFIHYIGIFFPPHPQFQCTQNICSIVYIRI